MAHAILIIEDEGILAKNLTRFLEREGFEARAVPSGEQGLPLLDSFRPDAILLDYTLPGMNGLEVLHCIRERAPEVKVIMITGHGGVELAVDALQAGASDFLSKPVMLTALKQSLDGVLDSGAPTG